MTQNENDKDLVVVTDKNNGLQIVKFDEIPENRETMEINVSEIRHML